MRFWGELGYSGEEILGTRNATVVAWFFLAEGDGILKKIVCNGE
jgi:hypothetical protein